MTIALPSRRPPRPFDAPAIHGLVPGFFAGRIDEGPRSGNPRDDRGSLVVEYGDGGAIARFTGRERGLTGRVIRLDENGEIVFFHDRGVSIGAMKRLLEASRAPEGASLPAR